MIAAVATIIGCLLLGLGLIGIAAATTSGGLLIAIFILLKN